MIGPTGPVRLAFVTVKLGRTELAVPPLAGETAMGAFRDTCAKMMKVCTVEAGPETPSTMAFERQ